jgi:hypothetical protein
MFIHHYVAVNVALNLLPPKFLVTLYAMFILFPVLSVKIFTINKHGYLQRLKGKVRFPEDRFVILPISIALRPKGFG